MQIKQNFSTTPKLGRQVFYVEPNCYISMPTGGWAWRQGDDGMPNGPYPSHRKAVEAARLNRTKDEWLAS